MSTKIVTLFTVCFLSAYVSSQSLGYAYWKFRSAPSNGYDNFSAIINVLADPGTSCDGLFASHQFFFKGGNGGYMGIQTNGAYDAPFKITERNQKYFADNIPAYPEVNTNATNPLANGKIAIFSIWDAINCEAATGQNIECVKFGGEGTGYSIHMGYDWTVNKYELKLSQGNKGSNWWGVNIYVNDKTTNPVYMGQIETPTSWGKISGGYDAFLEKYTGTSGCNGNFPQYASFDYGEIFNDNIFPYNSSYTVGANGQKCKCVTANITQTNHDVDYTINKALGGCN